MYLVAIVVNHPLANLNCLNLKKVRAIIIIIVIIIIITAKAESRMRVFSNMAATWPSKLYLTGGISYLTTGHTIAIARRLAVGKGS